MNTYLFYDLETSGLNPAFDQVYEFAAIRTNLDFEEIGRYEFLVKPTIDIIPTPEAMITHRLSLQNLLDSGEPENQAIQKIHALLNEPGTISLGYNTLSFDDEFLRFNFFRHLRTPYTHQFANGCRRMDCFPALLFYYHFRPDILIWPQTDDGKISLKLENLSKANSLAEGNAHRAMVDVEATLALAKHLAKDQKMWDYIQGFFIKETDLNRLAKLPQHLIGGMAYPYGLLFDVKLGSLNAFQAPVLCLGQHWHYKNQSIWMRLDDERFLQGDASLIPDIWPTKKKAGEPPFIVMPKDRFIRFSPERQELARTVLAYLQAHPAFFREIQQYILDYTYPTYPETDIDATLYQRGFPSNQELAEMAEFHCLEAKAQSVFCKHFKDPGLREIAGRYVGRFCRDALDAEAETHFAAYLDSVWITQVPRILGYKQDPKMIRHTAMSRIHAMKEGALLDAEQTAVLQELEQYLTNV